MTEEVQDHLFEPFFTTKDVDEGTGLGLAQVYGIVRQHDGAIEVETGPGEGAAFRIYLPAHHDEPEEATDAEVFTATSPHGQGETILLVEDNQALREAAQDMLRSLGYQVLPAADGREALALCASPRWSAACSSIDAVVTDLVMPHVGGKALMCELTGPGDQPDLKAVGITGYAVEDIADDLRGVGFVDLVHKPFDAERLARAVRRALDEGRDDGAA
jgi:CheY-like chemotaxis protein